jgi:hypothetical protein
MSDMEIGQIHEIPEFENKIQELTQDWNNQTEKVNLYKITNFLLGSVDILVCTIDDLLDKGIDKKVTVLMGVEKLYDYIHSSPLVPLWLKPFLSVIRSYIIYTLISIFIDWMVAKYRQGQWRNKKENVYLKQIKVKKNKIVKRNIKKKD